MTDLQARFHTVDDLPAPDLWREVETRALAMSAAPASGPAWLLIGLSALLMVGVGAAALFGSGLVEIPVLPDPSQTQSPDASPTVDPSPAPSDIPTPPPDDSSTWSAAGEFEGTGTATLLPDGRVLVTGIFGEFGSSTASALLFDPATIAWARIPDMREARQGNTATLSADGTMVLVTGGSYADTDDSYLLNTTEVLNLDTLEWRSFPSMLAARYGHTATLLPDGRLLVRGGIPPGLTPFAEVFDPASLSWTEVRELRTDSGGDTTLLADGRLLLLDRAQIYDPADGSLSQTGEMVELRRGCSTATRLLDGRVLVAGGGGLPGICFTGDLASAELFDPATGTWSATGAMTGGRSYHTASLLPDGRVLVAGGGYGFSQPVYETAELYDPGTGLWTPTSSMLSERTDHQAVTLADGRVLVFGGGWGAEIYDPDGEN